MAQPKALLYYTDEPIFYPADLLPEFLSRASPSQAQVGQFYVLNNRFWNHMPKTTIETWLTKLGCVLERHVEFKALDLYKFKIKARSPSEAPSTRSPFRHKIQE